MKEPRHNYPVPFWRDLTSCALVNYCRIERSIRGRVLLTLIVEMFEKVRGPPRIFFHLLTKSIFTHFPVFFFGHSFACNIFSLSCFLLYKAAIHYKLSSSGTMEYETIARQELNIEAF